MSHRLVAMIGALFLLLTSLAAATAQEATPAASPFGAVDLPTLDVTLTEDGFEGVPTSLDAGRYLITLTSEVEDGWLYFLQPGDMTVQEFLDMYVAFEASFMAATPPAEGEGVSLEDLMAAYNSAVIPGGVIAQPEAPGQVVLDLAPGEWIAWDDVADHAVIVEVTGEMPADLPEPEAAATITMGEYVIEVSDGELATGSQVVKVENIGAQPHFVEFIKVPEGFTDQNASQLVDMVMTGTPAPDAGFSEEDVTQISYTATQSRGTAMWIPLTLDEPGTYMVACWFPDISDMEAHAVHGMYEVIEVGG